jgi:hypothetical protein
MTDETKAAQRRLELKRQTVRKPTTTVSTTTEEEL